MMDHSVPRIGLAMQRDTLDGLPDFALPPEYDWRYFQPMELVQEIAALDVVSMTPIDALNKLFEINEKAKRI